jgi:hypothetical protein
LKSKNKTRRINYFFIIIFVILLGILSRKNATIPLFVGDLLYAVMVFFIVKLLLTKAKSIKIALFALLLCYAIEILQLYQAEWIIEIRKTLFGRYVLGEGFLWSDLLAYTFGVGIAYFAEVTFQRKKDNPLL